MVKIVDAYRPYFDQELLGAIDEHPESAAALTRFREILYSVFHTTKAEEPQELLTAILRIVDLSKEQIVRHNVDKIAAVDADVAMEIVKRVIRSATLKILTELQDTSSPLTQLSNFQGQGQSNGNAPRTNVVLTHDEELELEGKLLDYIDLALVFGSDQVISMLVAAGVINLAVARRATGILSEFVDIMPQGSGGLGIVDYPPEILRIPAVKEVMQMILIIYIYRNLSQSGTYDPDTFNTIDQYEAMVKKLPDNAESILGGVWKNANLTAKNTELEILRTGVIDFFAECAAFEPAEGVANSIERGGKMYPVPSLRQRLAIGLIGRQRHALVGFKPGDGKTNVPFQIWAKDNERRRNKGLPEGRMVGIIPPRGLGTLPLRFNRESSGLVDHSYVEEGFEPTVGIIESGASIEQIQEAIRCQIVFISQHMVGRERSEDGTSRQIYEMIGSSATKENPITVVFGDEAHNLNGDGVHAQWMRQLFSSIPNLHEEGHKLFLSGTPATSDLSGMNTTLSMLEHENGLPLGRDENQDQLAGSRRSPLDPHAFRLACLRHFISFDLPDEWKELIDIHEYDLSHLERVYWQMLIERDDLLEMSVQLPTCRLFVLNPRLVSGIPEMQWSLMDQLKSKLDAAIADGNKSIMVISSDLAAGITRRHPQDMNEEFPTVATALREYLDSEIEFDSIDGQTSARDRDRIFEHVRERKSNGSDVSVTLATAGTISEVLNLSFYDHVIILDPTYTEYKMEQLVKRFIREKNADLLQPGKLEEFLQSGEKLPITIQMIIAKDTVHPAMLAHAEINGSPICEFMRTLIVTDRAFQMPSHELDEVEYQTDQGTRFGTPIVQAISSAHQRQNREQWHLHNGGLQKEARYWEPPAMRREYIERHLDRPNGLTIPEETVLCTGILRQLQEKGKLKGNSVLDLRSSGHGILRCLRATSKQDENWDIISNHQFPELAEEGAKQYLRESKDTLPTNQASYTEPISQPETIVRESGKKFDVIVITNGFQNTLKPRESIAEYTPKEQASYFIQRSERAAPIIKGWECLNDDGYIVLSLPGHACSDDEREQLCFIFEAAGYNIVKQYTGNARSQDNETGDVFLAQVIVAQKRQITSAERKEHMEAEIEKIPFEYWQLEGFNAWDQNKKQSYKRRQGERRIPSDFVHQHFKIGRTDIHVPYGTEVREVLLEQYGEICAGVELLRTKHAKQKSLDDLPANQLEDLHALGLHRARGMGKNIFAFVSEQTQRPIRMFIDPLASRWKFLDQQ